MTSSLFLTATPADALIDVPRRLVVQGAAPGAHVTLAASTPRAGGVLWQAEATFVADAQGVVDLTRDAPIGGSYRGVSPMGLVWSQVPEDGKSREVFAQPVTRPLVTTVTALAAGDGGEAFAPSSVSFVQRLAADGVTRRDVREDGLVGTLYLPPGDGPFPAVMILNGSGGGINEPRAALYASHGYAAFALGYFKGPGLPDYISNTPLEYFAKGMDWLRRTVRPAHDFVALSGQSRGGELVLLLGATFPEAVSAVIGYVPSALIHSAQNACDPAIGREGPTWLLDGKPLPHIWENNRTASWAPFDEGPPPHRHTNAMLTALDDAQAVERARIPVEKIRGPVMLLSAEDDGSWPSSRYSRMVTERLAAHSHPYAVEHLDFEKAGHAIVFPYVPTTQLVYAHPVSGKISTGGGQPDANAIADERSWRAVLAFLARAVAERAQSQGQS
ncbi:acyl-CoA thioesterase/BAAT N-terminal domain-containing protein [Pandoraea nosoerga]|uniref:Palmitoyl-CoA hydrolase n=1 Tax=Pandoraea nosoerga TaxID=2508296 RepID=A0A5E4Y332_9BURK|nr:acyl-CoA thioesterase/bile acid-CoA:amino acid N-acyltransferase family protein [Pandoraea nosoerga]MBN4666188.1 acyl-CoA thioesterase/BAAT N-terminal domain-containing protein [Pandoraea nosoerga]MBN4676908.1 acyl-CoA thioesterase/BAAT N-terminal domain-containing protein [Pandoraea nosoerga]MBN4681577.1 acyl-CoA thioesterase/BAAT N-terminal domain-containing protein [Pandoraea nosoerga]MBN4745117.1 acyl-CoA thioesterase/BAAT N-terminal domain-containing protein [Pandoraea nosoerga]VVE4291